MNAIQETLQVGLFQRPEVVFIQPGRGRDERTGKVAYLVVTEFEDICNVIDIMKRPANEQEKRVANHELERDMQLAREGRL